MSVAKDKLQTTAAKGAQFGLAGCFSGDLANDCGQLELTQRLIRDLPYIDILIQSAATYGAGFIEQASVAEFDRQYQTNVRAPYILTQALLPMLKARRRWCLSIQVAALLQSPCRHNTIRPNTL